MESRARVPPPIAVVTGLLKAIPFTLQHALAFDAASFETLALLAPQERGLVRVPEEGPPRRARLEGHGPIATQTS